MSQVVKTFPSAANFVTRVLRGNARTMDAGFAGVRVSQLAFCNDRVTGNTLRGEVIYIERRKNQSKKERTRMWKSDTEALSAVAIFVDFSAICIRVRVTLVPIDPSVRASSLVRWY